MSTYEALDVMLNFGNLILAMLTLVTAIMFFLYKKQR
jgi:hypothetical protein